MIKWIKRRLGITQLECENRALRAQLKSHANYVVDKMAELKAYTRVDADMGMRGNNTIILTGVYKKRAFVKFYDVGDGEFRLLAEHLQRLKGHALIRHVDRPPPFQGGFDL